MVKLTLHPTRPFVSFPSFWNDEEWEETPFNQGLDVYETENDVVVKAAAPGIKPSDIDVTFEDGVLRISGKASEEEKKEEKKVVYQSRMSTSFNYATTLPRSVDASKLKAEIENGVVTITAPLAAEVKSRKIEVTVKGK